MPTTMQSVLKLAVAACIVGQVTSQANYGYITYAFGSYSTIAGGLYNTAYGSWASIGGGLYHHTYRPFSSIRGGRSNWLYGYGATINGGEGIEGKAVDD